MDESNIAKHLNERRVRQFGDGDDGHDGGKAVGGDDGGAGNDGRDGKDGGKAVKLSKSATSQPTASKKKPSASPRGEVGSEPQSQLGHKGGAGGQKVEKSKGKEKEKEDEADEADGDGDGDDGDEFGDVDITSQFVR